MRVFLILKIFGSSANYFMSLLTICWMTKKHPIRKRRKRVLPQRKTGKDKFASWFRLPGLNHIGSSVSDTHCIDFQTYQDSRKEKISMRTKRYIKHFFTFSIIITMLFNMALTSFASENVENPPLAAGSVTFSNLNENSYQQYTGINSNGNTCTVGIEPVSNTLKSSGHSWKAYL